MKILSFAHRLEIGGTQVNAIDLAVTLRDEYSHEVLYFAEGGPMLDLIREKNISYVPLVPGENRAMQLRRLIDRERPDLIHVWDRWQMDVAYWGSFIPHRLPMLVSCMEMWVPKELPKWPMTTFGTPYLVKEAARCGFSKPALLLPGVDVVHNSPEAVDSRDFTEKFFPDAGVVKVVTVSRLVSYLKKESLLHSIEAVRVLGGSHPIKFVIAGEGEDSGIIEARARAVNTELGREAVVLAGPLLDPRPAYAAADIVIGMGGSSLRGMSFGKPVIVVGEGGFASTLTSQTADWFYENGLYGLGDRPESPENVTRELKMLLESGEHRQRLGSLSRQFVTKHFSLSAVSRDFDVLCQEALAYSPPIGRCAGDVLQRVTRRAIRSVSRVLHGASSVGGII